MWIGSSAFSQSLSCCPVSGGMDAYSVGSGFTDSTRGDGLHWLRTSSDRMVPAAKATARTAASLIAATARIAVGAIAGSGCGFGLA